MRANPFPCLSGHGKNGSFIPPVNARNKNEMERAQGKEYSTELLRHGSPSLPVNGRNINRPITNPYLDGDIAVIPDICTRNLGYIHGLPPRFPFPHGITCRR